jgi:hypothetical protein
MSSENRSLQPCSEALHQPGFLLLGNNGVVVKYARNRLLKTTTDENFVCKKEILTRKIILAIISNGSVLLRNKLVEKV